MPERIEQPIGQPSADGQKFLITEGLVGGRPRFMMVRKRQAGLEQ